MRSNEQSDAESSSSPAPAPALAPLHTRAWFAAEALVNKGHPGFVPFRAWASARQVAPDLRKLSGQSTQIYEYIWRAWLVFLESRSPRLDWDMAQPDDVRLYLLTVDPSANSRKGFGASSITRARYRKILSNVYSHSVDLGRQDGSGRPETDPTQAVDVSDELPKREEPQSFLLPRTVWRRLEERAMAISGGASASRESAMIGLIMFEGLTVSELTDLEPIALGVTKAAEACTWGITSPTLLHLDGKGGGHRERTIQLSDHSKKALSWWFIERSKLPGLSTGKVFIPLRQRTPLSAKSAYLIVTDFLASAGLAGEHACLRHSGPNLLRNGCIQRWIEDQMPFAEIARRLGMKSTRALQRIVQECDTATMLRFNAEATQTGPVAIQSAKAMRGTS